MSKKRTYLRNLLLERSSWFEERALDKARQHGYDRVTPAMSRMFGHMSTRPAGISELAKLLGVSRQAVHKTANDAAKLGLIEFVPDPEDARVVRLQFSEAGWAMSASATTDFEDIEATLTRRLGARNLAELKRLLAIPWDDDEAEPPQERS